MSSSAGTGRSNDPQIDSRGVLAGYPEQLTGVESAKPTPSGAIVSTRVAPWMSSGTAVIALGGLGVLIDDALGLAILRNQPANKSLVSTEISISSLRPIPVSAGHLTARSRLVQLDQRGGFSTAEVRTSSGLLVALATQRARFIHVDDDPAKAPTCVPHASLPVSVRQLLWPRDNWPGSDSGGEYTFNVEDFWTNPLGNLHGGVSILLADFLATQVATPRPALRVASIQVSYVRPIPMDTAITYSVTALHQGRTFQVVTVNGFDERRRLATSATVSLH